MHSQPAEGRKRLNKQKNKQWLIAQDGLTNTDEDVVEEVSYVYVQYMCNWFSVSVLVSGNIGQACW